jgi:hypothetical protein
MSWPKAPNRTSDRREPSDTRLWTRPWVDASETAVTRAPAEYPGQRGRTSLGRLPAPPVVVFAGDGLAVTRDSTGAVVSVAAVFARLVAAT